MVDSVTTRHKGVLMIKFELNHRLIISLLSIASLSILHGRGLAQDLPQEATPPEKKIDSQHEPEQAQSKSAEAIKEPATNKVIKEAVQPVVDFQKGCRIVIKGLPPVKDKTPLLLKKQDGSKLSATATTTTNGKTNSILSKNSNCKQNVKGWLAEVGFDPETAPLQVRPPLIFEPNTSGWYRAKRPNSFTLGIGAGFQLPKTPMYRIEFGWFDPLLGFVINYDLGMASGDELKISGSSSYNLLLFFGNSYFLDFGFGSETRAAVFTPKRLVNGEVRDGLMASGSSKIGFVHLGFGNKWQWGGFWYFRRVARLPRHRDTRGRSQLFRYRRINPT